MGAGLQCRQHVGTHGIAGHQCRPGIGAMAGEDARIDAGVLLADDLDAGEVGAEAGGGELRFLVEQVALGDEHQPGHGGQRLKRLRDAGQRLDGVGEQFAAGGENLGDHAGVDAAAADVECGFQHRQG